MDMLQEDIANIITIYTQLMGEVRLEDIDQEIDAIQLVNGLKNILHYCFGVE